MKTLNLRDRRWLRTCVLSLMCFWGATSLLRAEPPLTPYSPKIAQQSDEGRLAVRGFKIPEGFQAELFAAEPLLANPVAFCIDEQGRVYVAETFRQEKGVEDNRGHMDWLHDDLQSQTVEDRLAMFKKHLREKVEDYAREHDRIRLIEDRDGDGRADRATVFADGFHEILDGTGAGVLARGGNVYFTCIPKLWLLRDDDGDGQADVRKPLHHGYGVRVAFRGHDLHGLQFGPDGRLYFSIGDRGFNIETEDGRRLARPDTGAVFRCNPDGSDLEVFAYGLRNPQELAFDQYGNLFTGDNNSDSGDRARWVYVVEGGDSGWRMHYQYLQDRGPWNREKLWHPAFEGQAADIVPPVAHLGDGPSGLVAYPGVGLPDRYDGHFFLCDFRGTSGRSGIRSFAVEPQGASFELVDSHEFLWSILATDVDFGYDGRMYVTDWVDGWQGLGKGRIYTVFHPQFATDPVVRQAARLMREGVANRSVTQLIDLLTHPDRRIRQEAQFALAEKKAIPELTEAATGHDHQLARLHAIWGLGQIGRDQADVLKALLPVLQDDDAEVRAQAAKVLGEARAAFALQELIARLEDRSLRVRFFAAIALGKLGNPQAIEPLLQMLAENNDQDPMLRHAGVMGLTGINDPQALLARAQHNSPAVRMGVLLALRRYRRPEVALFLNDAEPRLVLEAARAINDVPIDESTDELAALAGRPGLSDELLRRVMNANFRLGGVENAQAIATIAANAGVSEKLRLEAIEELKHWAEPPPLDRVLGSWRPLEPRSAAALPDIVRPALGGILSGADSVRKAGVQLAAHYGIEEVSPVLFEMLSDVARPVEVRVECLQALQSLGDERLAEAMQQALAADEARLRAAGRRLQAQLQPEEAVLSLQSALETGETVERQAASAVLATMKTERADRILQEWLDRLIAREVPLELQLDLIEAARKRGTPELTQKLAEFEAARPQDDPLAAYREALAGGNAQRGREIFFGRSEVSCRRCHKINDQGGEVGPDLSKIGREKNREYLLESLVTPDKTIAKGFETAVLALSSGKVLVGIVQDEGEEQLQLITAEGEVVLVTKDDIQARAAGKSAMPEDLVKKLSKSELRDLVEYLSTLTGH